MHCGSPHCDGPRNDPFTPGDVILLNVTQRPGSKQLRSPASNLPCTSLALKPDLKGETIWAMQRFVTVMQLISWFIGGWNFVNAWLLDYNQCESHTAASRTAFQNHQRCIFGHFYNENVAELRCSHKALVPISHRPSVGKDAKCVQKYFQKRRI